jgi:DeoR family fructose operon transcriptional repressor
MIMTPVRWKESAMLKPERHQRLLAYVNSHKRATVDELSDVLTVSKVTVRRDLDELNDAGLLVKTFGGALSKDSVLSMEIPSSEKTSRCIDEKRRIGARCAEMIDEGDVVILDSGTTTLEIARRVGDKHITVITNDLNIAMALTARRFVTVLLAGGLVQAGVNVTLGHETERSFHDLHANKTFLAADAWSEDDGVTDRSYAQLPIKQAMLHAGQRVILVTDHTKAGQHVFAQVCPLSSVDALVTDAMDAALQESLQATGIEVILA